MKTPSGVRFAPSPTGAFHVGNLRTAWVSWAWAKALKEPWVVRFEDIDAPRAVPGAKKKQLADLAVLGMVPDEVITQSERIERHWELFGRAIREGAVYPCACSRQDVRHALSGLASAPHTQPETIYSGHCRNLKHLPKHELPTIGWRFRAPEASGGQDFLIARTGPDAQPGQVPKREEFAPAYHWACAIDDLDGVYRLLVRAWDLAPAAVTQRLIMQWADPKVAPAAIFHTALVVTPDGHRLEKRTKGVTLSELIAKGATPKQVLERFETSYSFGFPSFALRDVFGEDLRELSLSALSSQP